MLVFATAFNLDGSTPSKQLPLEMKCFVYQVASSAAASCCRDWKSSFAIVCSHTLFQSQHIKSDETGCTRLPLLTPRPRIQLSLQRSIWTATVADLQFRRKRGKYCYTAVSAELKGAAKDRFRFQNFTIWQISAFQSAAGPE